MSIYPPIDFFPLFDGPLQYEIELHEKAKKYGLPTQPLKPVTKINSALDFLMHTIANYSCSGVVHDFHSKILDSRAFAEIKRLTPYLKDISSTNLYRNIPQKAELHSVDAEIRDFGSLLPSGQTLFHGGSLPLNRPLVTNRPLSTTYCPQVALWHADNDRLPDRNPTPVVWVLTVGQACSKKAIVFKKGGSNMANEFEVLIESGVIVSPTRCQTKSCVFGQLQVIEAELN
ncbi:MULTISPECIES: hypothetical protein [Vibrio]|uniref:hypothetical protein n=1 Tax=Vibrio TaxID=662 RepID=UPI001483502D|nr:MULTISPECIES: hypothetical protein [Vibrio]